ncbi:MAG TPA: hypothetical protein VD794_08610, partial [Flavisolibacter sp.]|nr:hypothetical protein [Flavisolibacter sp.]
MKLKVLFFFLLSLTFSHGFAQNGERLVMRVLDTFKEYYSSPDPQKPCENVAFIFLYNRLPEGYASIERYEWFIDGLLYHTSTD